MSYPADFNGDGTQDIAIYRPSSGLWSIRDITRAYFGGANDCPVPSDYSGDRIDDIAIFNASSGLWAIKDITRVYYGSTGDISLSGGARGPQGEQGIPGPSVMPAPSYNSGWVTIGDNEEITLFHNLGGDPDNYVVDMQNRSNDSWLGINIYHHGLTDNVSPYFEGSAWWNLNTQSITIFKYEDSTIDYMRIRIWRY